MMLVKVRSHSLNSFQHCKNVQATTELERKLTVTLTGVGN